jgi:hypothetical protein
MDILIPLQQTEEFFVRINILIVCGKTPILSGFRRTITPIKRNITDIDTENIVCKTPFWKILSLAYEGIADSGFGGKKKSFNFFTIDNPLDQ